MSTDVLAPDARDPASNGLKNKLVDQNNEEKDGSSAGSIEETTNHGSPYMMNNADHNGDDMDEVPVPNGTTPSHYQSKISALEQRNKELEGELEQKERKIGDLTQLNIKLSTLKQELAKNFTDKRNEANEHKNKVMHLQNVVENEAEEKKRYKLESEKSRSSLLEFERRGITIDKHEELTNKLKNMEMNNNDNINNNNNNNNNDDGKYQERYEDILKERNLMIKRQIDFKANVKAELTQIRQVFETSNKEMKMNEDIGKELEVIKNTNKRLEDDTKNQNKAIKKLQNEKSSQQKQINILQQKINQQNGNVTKHQQELKKKEKELKINKEKWDNEKQLLEEQNEKLTTKLNDERKEWAKEKSQRTNLKEESARKINQQKKEVSRQLDKEQEFRINLEHKLQTVEDSLKKKKTAISKLNTNIRTLELKLENEEKKNLDCLNEQKNLKRKCDDAIQSELKSNEQMLAYESELNEKILHLEKMKEQNETLRESMRKKDAKLKALQEKEAEISKNLQDAETKKRQAQKNLEKVKKLEDKLKQRADYGNRSSRINSNLKKPQSWFQRNDPLNQYRNILPCHWIAIFFAFIAFVLFCRANL